MNDPIVDEVRRVRDAHASRFNCDLDAIFRDIKEQERVSGRAFVSFPPRKLESRLTSICLKSGVQAWGALELTPSKGLPTRT
jgi:hypothetical protein